MPRFLTALPVYNEAAHVDAVLDEVLKVTPDVLVVDDGSSDGTGALLAGRLAWLSLFEGERYQLKAQENRVQNRLIPPRRGWIVESRGASLGCRTWC